jgi:hypothetical protein
VSLSYIDFFPITSVVGSSILLFPARRCCHVLSVTVVLLSRFGFDPGAFLFPSPTARSCGRAGIAAVDHAAALAHGFVISSL